MDAEVCLGGLVGEVLGIGVDLYLVLGTERGGGWKISRSLNLVVGMIRRLVEF